MARSWIEPTDGLQAACNSLATRPGIARCDPRMTPFASGYWSWRCSYRRYGYQRLHVLLHRDGFMLNHKKTYRLYREEQLLVRQRKRRRQAATGRLPLPAPSQRNLRWSLDFVSDQLMDGRRFRCLTVMDQPVARGNAEAIWWTVTIGG